VDEQVVTRRFFVVVDPEDAPTAPAQFVDQTDRQRRPAE
jgi:hypothetical protein